MSKLLALELCLAVILPLASPFSPSTPELLRSSLPQLGSHSAFRTAIPVSSSSLRSRTLDLSASQDANVPGGIPASDLPSSLTPHLTSSSAPRPSRSSASQHHNPISTRRSLVLGLALGLSTLALSPSVPQPFSSIAPNSAEAAEPILLQPLTPSAPPPPRSVPSIPPSLRNPDGLKLPPPKDPYEAMEPAGKSYLGNKGPNLQLPEELSGEDAVPQRKLDLSLKGVKKQVNLADIDLTDLGASIFWGVFLYYGIFDINLKTNVISQARGDEGDERPSDWVKVRLGEALDMPQDSWQDDWTAPLPLQAFTVSLFAALGVASERSIALGLGSSDGFFALSGALTSCIWAGVYELGRTQRVGYRASREEQEEMEAQVRTFAEFAEERLEVKPTGRVYIKDVTKAFRQTYAKYRSEEQLSERRLQTLFRQYARRVTGMRGKSGFFKGIGLRDRASAFGTESYSMQRNREAEKARDQAREEAQKDAEEALNLAIKREDDGQEPPTKRSEEV